MKAFFGDTKRQRKIAGGFDWHRSGTKVRVLRYFEMMKQGKVNGYICGALTGGLIPEQKQSGRVAFQTQNFGDYRPLNAPKRPPSGKTTVSRTTLIPQNRAEVLPSAFHLFCRGKWFPSCSGRWIYSSTGRARTPRELP